MIGAPMDDFDVNQLLQSVHDTAAQHGYMSLPAGLQDIEMGTVDLRSDNEWEANPVAYTQKLYQSARETGDWPAAYLPPTQTVIDARMTAGETLYEQAFGEVADYIDRQYNGADAENATEWKELQNAMREIKALVVFGVAGAGPNKEDIEASGQNPFVSFYKSRRNLAAQIGEKYETVNHIMAELDSNRAADNAN